MLEDTKFMNFGIFKAIFARSLNVFYDKQKTFVAIHKEFRTLPALKVRPVRASGRNNNSVAQAAFHASFPSPSFPREKPVVEPRRLG